MRTFRQADKIANKILTMLDNRQTDMIPAYITNKENIELTRLNKFYNIRKKDIDLTIMIYKYGLIIWEILIE